MPGLLQNLWSRLTAPSAPETKPLPLVIIHDPQAAKAHDLDDPFFDSKVQSRIADVIAHAAEHPKK